MCGATESSKEINRSPKNHGWAVKAPHTLSLLQESHNTGRPDNWYLQYRIQNTGQKIRERNWRYQVGTLYCSPAGVSNWLFADIYALEQGKVLKPIKKIIMMTELSSRQSREYSKELAGCAHQGKPCALPSSLSSLIWIDGTFFRLRILNHLNWWHLFSDRTLLLHCKAPVESLWSRLMAPFWYSGAPVSDSLSKGFLDFPDSD